MLNKLRMLLKYEFRFYFRILLPIYIALMLVALTMRFQGNPAEMSSFLLQLIWGALIVAMLVITIVQIIQRFINNFMKDQGSLMFTLPVNVWTLLSSKVIASFCMCLMSLIPISVLPHILTLGTKDGMFSSWMLNLRIPNFGEIMIIAPVFCAMILQEICLVYVVITISHLLPRFRFIAGCGIYLAINSFLEKPVLRFASKSMKITFETYSQSAVNNEFVSLIPWGVAALIFAALYFWVTGFLLKRTFNLE